jgi:DNA-binding transcriptional LysR family regulator
MVTGLMERRFDLAIISLPYDETNLTIVPLFDEELLILRPSSKPVRTSGVRYISPQELAEAKFLLYPPRSNMRSIIDTFFRDINVIPQVAMEADDTEVMKKLVESGFGYGILPESALHGTPRFFYSFRVRDRKIIRRQALAMMKSEYPRALTLSIAEFLRSTLSAGNLHDE